MNSLFSRFFSEEGPAQVVRAVFAVRRRTPKKNKHDDIVFVIRTLVAFSVIALVFSFSMRNGNTAKLTLYIGDQQRVFMGEVIPGMTVLDALHTSTSVGNIPFVFSIQKGRTEILQFGGITSGDLSARLMFFRNSERINGKIIHEIPVVANDDVVVRLVKAAQ